MIGETVFTRIQRNTLGMALVITRREIRDNLRDWRIMTPIFILTLIFPGLMNVAARLTTNFLADYDAPIIAERLIPFLLLVVGFFPISFSLVIALETFAGEKERNSIEPLLSMPVTDFELYLGKMLAALFVPLTASYTGIAVYLVGLYFTIGWVPDWWLFTQIFILTTVEGLVMVSGSVVVSSQTTSVRAANLLASFIIVPMALLLQAEAVLLFWGNYQVIWLLILGLMVVAGILIRMGVRIFNREEILSREIDTVNIKNIALDFRAYFVAAPRQTPLPINRPAQRFDLKRMLLSDLGQLLRNDKLAIGVVTLTLLAAAIGGAVYAHIFQVPAGLISLQGLSAEAITENADAFGILPSFSATWVFGHNTRTLFLSAALGLISFGVTPVVLLMFPIGLIGYFAETVNLLGYNPWLFLGAFIAPHGIVELPAAIISTAFALRVGASMVSPPEGFDLGQGILMTLANFTKIFLFLVLPMLLVAAVLETQLTPQVVGWVYGG